MEVLFLDLGNLPDGTAFLNRIASLSFPSHDNRLTFWEAADWGRVKLLIHRGEEGFKKANEMASPKRNKLHNYFHFTFVDGPDAIGNPSRSLWWATKEIEILAFVEAEQF